MTDNINDLIQKVVDTEMDGILKKIDTEIAEIDTSPIGVFNVQERDIWNNGYNSGTAYGLQQAKEIILSEQKEPCTDSKICPKCNRIISYDSYFKKMICRQCGYAEVLQPKEPTRFDKITESPASPV